MSHIQNPPSGTKWTKAEADYKVQPDRGGCRVCDWLEDDNTCPVVGGGVSRNGGCCDYWQDMDATDRDIGKEAAGYVEVKPSTPGFPPVFLCGDCADFRGPRACRIVSGLIRPADACSKWTAAPTVGAKALTKAEVRSV